MEKTGKSKDEAQKIYEAVRNDSTKLTVDYTHVEYSGLNILNDINIMLTDEELKQIEDGTYQSNLGTIQTQDPAGSSKPNSDLEGSEQYDWGGVLFKPISALITGLASACNMLMERIFIGDKAEIFIDTGFLKGESEVDAYIGANPAIGDKKEDNEENNADNKEKGKGGTVEIVKDYIETAFGKYGVPNVRLTSAEIFAGNVAALDANFFKTNTDYKNSLGGEDKSIVLDLKETISKWYVALRNIAIVGLLSVLLYIGIRIVISSSNADKAKYKQFFVDWVIALCLIFFLHYIMAFTMTMAETITDVFAGETTQQGTIKQVNIQFIDESRGAVKPAFASNFSGVALLKSQYKSSGLAMGYSVMYLALTIYTGYFAFVYLKRLLMLAFFTMIAPLVALTYPIDKMKDGKAQAFNYWFKEYMFYALLQPLHMLLYTVFVSSALSIAAKNLIYAIVAMAFIVPAEKIMKQMFGIKGQTESSLGGFAGGALASQAFHALTKGKKQGGNGNAQQDKIKLAKNPNTPNPMEALTGAEQGADSALAAGAATAMSPVDENAENADLNTGDGAMNNQMTGANNSQDNGLSDGQNSAQDNNDIFSTDEESIDIYRRMAKGEISPERAMKEMNKLDKARQKSERRKTLANNFDRALNQRYVSAGGWKGIAKKAAIGAGKGYVKALGMGAMGAAGLGAGMVGGDLGDMWKGMGAGAVAGNVLANRTNKAIANTAAGNNAVGRFVNDVKYGDEEGRKKHFIDQYKNDPSTVARILEKNPDWKLKEVREQQEREAAMMYDTGIDDYSTIKGAVKLEKAGNSHDYAVAIAQLSKNYDPSTFIHADKKDQAIKGMQKNLEKRLSKQIEEQIEKQVSNIQDSNAREAKKQQLMLEQSAKLKDRSTQYIKDIGKVKGVKE